MHTQTFHALSPNREPWPSPTAFVAAEHVAVCTAPVLKVAPGGLASSPHSMDTIAIAGKAWQQTAIPALHAARAP